MTSAFLAAIGLLTRIPVNRAFTASDMANATAFYPLVGVLVGGLQVAAIWCGGGLPSAIVAIGVVGLSTVITGALHLDGLADTADGFGGGRTRADVLAIMRDPRVGTYGVVALVLTLLLKTAALDDLIGRNVAVGPVLVAPVVARWAMVAVASILRYARVDGGLGVVAQGATGGRGFVLATLMALTMITVVAGRDALVYGVVTLVVTAAAGFTCRHRIGGFTGDTLGATGELTEAAILFTAVTIA